MRIRIKLLLLYYKIRVKYFPKITNPYTFNKILKLEGICVGEHTIFYSPNSQTIDRQRPWMLKIGDYCKITKGVIILTHDYSRSVLRRKYGEILGEARQTIIGDNVFIGMNSIVLMGTNIGNNVIIGAGSVVSGSIPDDCVAAGNPARIICKLDTYYEKRKRLYICEAKEYAKSFIREHGRYPTIHEMGPFFPLFLERTEKALVNNRINMNLNGDDTEDVLKCFLSSTPLYDSYEDFIKHIDSKC